MSGKSTRQYHRFKDFFRGRIEYLGSSYLCLVEDIGRRGLRMLSDAPVDVGDRMRVDLHVSPDARFSCVIEIRQVTRDGLRAEIVDIADADAGVLSGRIEEHYSAVRLAKAKCYAKAVKAKARADAKADKAKAAADAKAVKAKARADAKADKAKAKAEMKK